MINEMNKLSGAVEIGVLADDVVTALEQAVHGGALSVIERDALKTAKEVLERMAHPDISTGAAGTSACELRELVATREQAIGVAKRHVAPEAFIEFFIDLSQQLDQALHLEGRAEDPGEFERALDFFEGLSDATLAGARDELTTLAEPAWMSSRPTGLF